MDSLHVFKYNKIQNIYSGTSLIQTSKGPTDLFELEKFSERRFAKIIFYFLRGHTNSKSSHVSCELFVGKNKRLFLLKKELVG